MQKSQRTKQLTTMAMMAALAYIVTMVSKGLPPMFLFLRYDPKDIVLAITGFIYGPFSAFLVSVLVSLIEMFTLSETGVIGFFMNVLASTALIAPAALIYKRRRTLKGAVYGLICGILTMTLVMLLWNYIITPIYMGIPREKVVELLVPAILPFNLIKGSINAALIMIIYKPVVETLRKVHLIPQSHPNTEKAQSRAAVLLVSLLVLATSVLIVMILNGRF